MKDANSSSIQNVQADDGEGDATSNGEAKKQEFSPTKHQTTDDH